MDPIILGTSANSRCWTTIPIIGNILKGVPTYLFIITFHGIQDLLVLSPTPRRAAFSGIQPRPWIVKKLIKTHQKRHRFQGTIWKFC